MKLTRKKAIELCIEVWTWCMETGKLKSDYPYSEKQLKYVKEDDYPESHCWFCEYCLQHKDYNCKGCPLGGDPNSPECEKLAYLKWDEARTPRTRKKYAKLFLSQIKSLRSK